MKTDKVPKLRFPQFHGEWVTKPLSEVCSYTKGFAFKAKDFGDSGVRVIRVSDLSADSIKNDNEMIFFPIDEAKKYGKYKIRQGNILITTVGSRPTLKDSAVGRAIFIDNSESFLLNQNLLKIECNDDVSSGFVFRYFNSPKYIDFITAIQRGNANQSNITVKDLFSYLVAITNIEEQQKIADFLSAVDEKIRLLKEKHALLQQYKKGVMQKLFSQEIRFKDDNNQAFPDWSDTPVSEFMTESKLLGSKGDQAKKLTVKLWGKGVFAKDESQKGSENTQYYTRSSGQFIYSKLDFLNCAFGIVPEELDGYESTVDLPCFDVAPSINKYFILEYIKQKRFYKKFGDMADGSRKAKRIHAKDFLSFIVELPSESEQQKIAEFLQALDTKLDAVQQQIELTQTFKKGLLQQMFV